MYSFTNCIAEVVVGHSHKKARRTTAGLCLLSNRSLAATSASASSSTSASREPCAMFALRVVAGIPYMALAVARFVSLKVGEWLRSAIR